MSLGEINYKQLVSIGKIILKCSQYAFAMIAIISNKINKEGGFGFGFFFPLTGPC